MKGHHAAETNLLLQHILGQSKLREPGKVFARLQELAKTGDREAENNLGLCFEFGYGTAQDFREAAVWYLRAAKGGLGTAQFNLGGFYFEGKGVEKNFATAVMWYTRAAEQRQELALKIRSITGRCHTLPFDQSSKRQNGYDCKFLKQKPRTCWSGREDLNLRPPGPEPGALPG